MNDAIPTQADWESESWDLDTQQAHRQFGGKSFEEAIELFKENAIHYQEDVCFMPRACFPFYARAYMAYLLSDASKDDSDGANCFFGFVKIRAEEIVRTGSLYLAVADTLRHIATRQDWYDADQSIYGSFVEHADEALARLRSFFLYGQVEP